ncbi:MAG: amidohydrolase family protein [Gammaproteobacteria bacterium]|nr:amidohydrolase family protein [Gammaproteobacteria bacterium]
MATFVKPMAKKAFAVFDSDSHVVEPRALWEKYLDPDYRVLGKAALWREEGPTNCYLKVNGKMFRDTMNPNIPRLAIWRPGITWAQVGELDPDIRHAPTRGASDPQARLADMGAMGIDQTLLYLTLVRRGLSSGRRPDVARALARAHNDWIADFCAVARAGCSRRPWCPAKPDFAIAELERIATMPCFRGAFIRPMFIENRYFTHPYYDPLWGRALEVLGITAAVHPATGLWNPEWTSHAPFIEKMKGRLSQMALLREAGGGPFAGGGNGANLGFSPTGSWATSWRR